MEDDCVTGTGNVVEDVDEGTAATEEGAHCGGTKGGRTNKYKKQEAKRPYC